MSDVHPSLISFGNPLLDMTLVVTDKVLHNRFGLPVDGQLEIKPEQKALFDIAMKRDDIEYSAGGCALNTSRVFSWVLGERNQAVFVGGVGKDERAQKLDSIIQKSGVITRYVEVENESTGSCVALVLGAQRCLSADIGAAAFCEPEHVFVPETLHLMESCSIIYIEGYFITHSYTTALKVAQYALRKNKLLVFNLCGSYVCENHPKELAEILPYVDILFGYVEEYRTLNDHIDIPEICSRKQLDSQESVINDLENVFAFLFQDKVTDAHSEKVLNNGTTSANCDTILNGDGCINDSSVVNGTRERRAAALASSTDEFISKVKKQKLLVVTQGSGPIVFTSFGEVLLKDVAPIGSNEMVDTTGAGDSFVGGFLAALVRRKTLNDCLDCGAWTAQQLLRQKGCTIPSYPATIL